MQIECINYDKCASKNTTRCEKCEFNKLRNKKADFFKADMVKEGAAVVDVGINRVDGKLCGDVDFA